MTNPSPSLRWSADSGPRCGRCSMLSGRRTGACFTLTSWPKRKWMDRSRRPQRAGSPGNCKAAADNNERKRNMAGRSGTITERFWAKVKKTDGCWEWTGAKHKRGYGLIRSKEISMYRAHRLSWVIHNGPIPDGLHVPHDCDTPSCTRPDHLFLGTHKDNMEDATRKGRM